MRTGHTSYAADSHYLYIRNMELRPGRKATLQKYSFGGTMRVSSEIRPLTALMRQGNLLYVISNREIVTMSTGLEYISTYVMQKGSFLDHTQWTATQNMLIALDSETGTLHLTDLKDLCETVYFEKPLKNECEGTQLLSYGNRAFTLDTVAELLYELDLSAFH